MNALETRRLIQRLLHVAEDGDFGPRTHAAFQLLDDKPPNEEWPATSKPDGVHEGKASSFADPADIASFKRCKATGKTDRQCFAVGDNGIGKWGDDTTQGNGPMCALPPEDWQQFGTEARGKKVLVKANGREVVCELRDTMPHKANVRNGAVIDLNPDACDALVLRPPVMVDASWEWA